eukprot:403365291
MEALNRNGFASNIQNDANGQLNQADSTFQQQQEMQALANQSLGNDLWILAAQKVQEQLSISQEKTVVFVGEKSSGKSSLISKFLDEPVKDDMKETTALDFRYGTRIKDEKKQKVNIYELGGGRIVANLLAAPLTAFHISNSAVCIVLDLSSPGGAIDSLQYWIAVIREHSQKAIEELQKTNPKVFQMMQQRVQERFEKHDDRNKINVSMVPIIVIGSKFDIFANQYESVKKRQLCLALRYICHQNGCDLVFASVKEKLPSQLFKAMITRHVFDSNLQAKVEKDHNQALNIYAGSDNFSSIGEPEGAGMRGKVSFEKLWQDIIEQQFPKANSNQQGVQLGDLKKYAEEKIDAMRQQKDEELEQYKKEIERSKRFESQKIAGGAQVGPLNLDGKISVKKKVVASGSIKRAAPPNR